MAPSCLCGSCEKCRDRLRAKLRWAAMTSKERRAIEARRDPEKRRATSKAAGKRYRQSEHGRKTLNAQRQRWVQRHPEKRRAHRLVQKALKNGDLVRPSTCSIEGCEGSPPHAHHDDYGKPLEVQWLCAQHHMDHHRGIAF